MRRASVWVLLSCLSAGAALAQNPAKGKLVITCSKPLRLKVDGRRSRCGPARGEMIFRLEEGFHELVWRAKNSGPVPTSVSVEAGETVMMRLPQQAASAIVAQRDPAGQGVEGDAVESASSGIGGSHGSSAEETTSLVPTAVPSPAAAPVRDRADAAMGLPTHGTGPRFVVNGDGTVTDRKMGLMWTQQDSGAALGRCLFPYQATSYVAFLTTGGHRDWRIPTLAELASLAEGSAMNLARDGKTRLYLNSAFSRGGNRYHWSQGRVYQVLGPNGVGDLHGIAYDFASKDRYAAPASPYWGSCGDMGVRAVRTLQ